MAEESFENTDVSEILNKNFISIKVDREERPDIDHFYMSSCIALNGSGGWPLSVFLDHERKPFYASTYFPKNKFIHLLNEIVLIWGKNRDKINTASKSITEALREKSHCSLNVPTISTAIKAMDELMASYDSNWGGFGTAPKFPSPHNLLFLMRGNACEKKDSYIWNAIRHTLISMSKGGIRDHIGGGFCRYSTDERWLVPHFEKMLYDNALLCMAYTEFYEKTGELEGIVFEIIEFVKREMLSPNGCFYTAIDADSEGIEGKYYCFNPKEVRKVLGNHDGDMFCMLYGITTTGNFEHGSIPNLVGITLTEEEEQFTKRVIPALYEERLKRINPKKDEKILLTSNALMIAALAKAGRVFSNPSYTHMACICADFLLDNIKKDDRLYAHWNKETGPVAPATLDGYSYLIWALLECRESALDGRYLQKAKILHREMMELFSGENGELFYSGKDIKDLPLRGINAYDGAIPSGQAVAAHNMLKLYNLTDNNIYIKEYEKLLCSVDLSSSRLGHIWLLSSIFEKQGGCIAPLRL